MALARWQATVVDGTGDVLPSASVEVRSDVPGQPLVALFSDRDGLVPIANPFLADVEGFAAFHVVGGSYKITATLGGFTRIWRYVAIGTAAALDGEAIVGVAGASGGLVGDGATVAFDITVLIGSAASLLWVEDGIVQRPGIDFTVSGSVVTRTTAPAEDAIILWVLFGSAGDVTDLSTKVDKAGDAMSGPLSLSGDGASALHAVPKQQLDATIAAAVVGLIDDRGNYDASVNTFPASGGSGTAGAILKGDLWFISVAGTLGGVAVAIGDQVRALVDTPGQTAGNWAISEANVGFVPENVANKDTDGALAANSDTKYASQKATKTYADTKAAKSSNGSDFASPKTAFDNFSVKGADIASASTIDLDAATGNLLDITGTTAITAVTLAEGRERTVRFTGILTFTNGASLVLPNAGSNITTAAGDFARLRGYAGGVVRCVQYTRASGAALAGGAGGSLVSTTQLLLSGTTYTKPAGVQWIEVFIVGAGGGGGSSGSSGSTDGGTGGDTTFNSVVAKGGIGSIAAPTGAGTSGNPGGRGGQGGAGTAIRRSGGNAGGTGGGGVTSVYDGSGGNGGAAVGWGGGGAGMAAAAATAGETYGGGGGGAKGGAGGSGGAGGGGGGEVAYLIIDAPAATYTYAIGAAGTGASAGTAGSAGAAGAQGCIFVIEHY